MIFPGFLCMALGMGCPLSQTARRVTWFCVTSCKVIANLGEWGLLNKGSVWGCSGAAEEDPSACTSREHAISTIPPLHQPSQSLLNRQSLPPSGGSAIDTRLPVPNPVNRCSMLETSSQKWILYCGKSAHITRDK